MVELGDVLRRGEDPELCRTLVPSLTQALHTWQAGQWGEWLNQLDPIAHSLGYMFALDGRTLPVAGNGDNLFFERATTFLMNCNHLQIRLAPERFVSVCAKYKDHAIALQKTRNAVLPLRTAVAKLAPSDIYITPIHAHLFQLCILSKCYNAALPALSEDAFNVDPAVTGMTLRDVLLYSYYGGMIHAARRKYSAAIETFMIAMTVPMYQVNAIAVAAWKKYVLVSLIHTGNAPTLPKYATAVLTRVLKSEGGMYNDLAQTYNKSTKEWDDFVQKHQQKLTEDGNMGLVVVATRERTMRAIQKLTQTHMTLSMQTIADRVGLPSAHEAELLLLRMIEDGQIFAVIDDSVGMVRFLEDPEDYGNSQMLSRMDAQLRRAVLLSERLQACGHAVACDRNYLNRMQRDNRNNPEDTATEQEVALFDPTKPNAFEYPRNSAFEPVAKSVAGFNPQNFLSG